MFMPRPLKAPPRTFETNGFWHWKPSARLRDEGKFRTVSLGQDQRAAFAQARLLNKQADEWLGSAGPARRKKVSAGAEPVAALTFGQLVAAYLQSPKFKELRATTQKGYRDCIRILEAEFAHDRAERITHARVLAWADPLRATAPQGLRHYAAVARAIFNWGRKRALVTLAENPFDGLEVSAGRRKKRILEADLRLLVAEADAGWIMPGSGGEVYHRRPDIGTAMIIAFFCVQRISDVLRLTTNNLVEGGTRLVLTQSKTGKVVEFSLPQPVQARLAAYPPKDGGSLTAVEADNLDQAARDAFSHILARLIKKARDKPLTWRGLDWRLTGLQLRDMRRSGFCFYAEKPGITVHQICSISGHTVAEGMDIVETYLPKTSQQADMAIAMAAAKW